MEIPERGHVVMEAMLFGELPNNRTKLTIHDICFSVEDSGHFSLSRRDPNGAEIPKKIRGQVGCQRHRYVAKSSVLGIARRYRQ